MRQEQEDIQRLIRQARRAEPNEDALARVWQRLQAPPPVGPGDGGIEVPAPEALADATQALAGKAALVAGLKTIAAATVIGAAIVGGRWIAGAEEARAPVAVSGRAAEGPGRGTEDARAPAPVEVEATAVETSGDEARGTEAVEGIDAARGGGRRARAQGGPDLAAERGVLAAAQAALKAGETATALQRLDEHKRRFAGGVLADEREMLRVLALCAEQRAAEAESAARALLGEGGSGLFVPRLRGSCVGERLAPLLGATGEAE